MFEACVRFVQKGDPNGAGLPPWPTHERRSEPYLEFGDDIVLRNHLSLTRLPSSRPCTDRTTVTGLRREGSDVMLPADT
jgi:hypothetical protein